MPEFLILSILALLALLVGGTARGQRLPGPSWFDLPITKESAMPYVAPAPFARALLSKKARGRAQQTAAHRRRRSRR